MPISQYKLKTYADRLNRYLESYVAQQDRPVVSVCAVKANAHQFVLAINVKTIPNEKSVRDPHGKPDNGVEKSIVSTFFSAMGIILKLEAVDHQFRYSIEDKKSLQRINALVAPMDPLAKHQVELNKVIANLHFHALKMCNTKPKHRNHNFKGHEILQFLDTRLEPLVHAFFKDYNNPNAYNSEASMQRRYEKFRHEFEDLLKNTLILDHRQGYKRFMLYALLTSVLGIGIALGLAHLYCHYYRKDQPLFFLPRTQSRRLADACITEVNQLGRHFTHSA